MLPFLQDRREGFSPVHTVQRAECEEGMPPESTTARMSHTPCLNLFVKICRPTQVVCLPTWQPGQPYADSSRYCCLTSVCSCEVSMRCTGDTEWCSLLMLASHAGMYLQGLC